MTQTRRARGRRGGAARGPRAHRTNLRCVWDGHDFGIVFDAGLEVFSTEEYCIRCGADRPDGWLKS